MIDLSPPEEAFKEATALYCDELLAAVKRIRERFTKDPDSITPSDIQDLQEAEKKLESYLSMYPPEETKKVFCLSRLKTEQSAGG